MFFLGLGIWNRKIKTVQVSYRTKLVRYGFIFHSHNKIQIMNQTVSKSLRYGIDTNFLIPYAYHIEPV